MVWWAYVHGSHPTPCQPPTTAFSALAVAGFLYTSAVVLMRGFQVFADRPDPWDGVVLFNCKPVFLNAIPLMVFGYQCHTNVRLVVMA